MKKLALVHTVPPLLPVFDKLAAELLPGVQPLHVLDGLLLERIRLRGRLAPEDSARLSGHVSLAREVGAQAVLVTCSTISPCVDSVRSAAGIPVVRIDEAMIERAVDAGARIGVIATNRTTLEPTRRLLQARAGACGKKVEIELVLVEAALPALLRGEGAVHDELVKEATLELAQRTDVIVLAQASIARVLDVIPAAVCAAPIFSGPHLALEQVKRLLAAT